jgi:hypothetical protein
MTQATLKKFLVQVSMAVATEVVLNLVGLDAIADYHEFILGETMAAIQAHTLVVNVHQA